MSELHDKAVDAAAMFLQRKGFEVKSVGWKGDGFSVDVAAMDEDTIVFVDVIAGQDSFPSTEADKDRRKRLEDSAFAWLSENLDFYVEAPVRFDEIALRVLGNGKALLRYAADILGTAESESE